MYPYTMLLDRRGKKRENLRTVAEYKTLKVPKGLIFKAPLNIVKASLLDISISGCALESPYAIPPQVTISIRIDPLAFAIGTSERRNDPLEMTGRITSSVSKGREHYRLGVCFIRIKKKDAGLIKRFMRSKERRKFPRFSFSR
ncbi:MAG: PilZ domain-containing protein [Candidatus Omnitrophica bacterium]|nr:PilZ domain-containing protein [Candidatus Omnitrophota bacterium]